MLNNLSMVALQFSKPTQKLFSTNFIDNNSSWWIRLQEEHTTSQGMMPFPSQLSISILMEYERTIFQPQCKGGLGAEELQTNTH